MTRPPLVSLVVSVALSSAAGCGPGIGDRGPSGVGTPDLAVVLGPDVDSDEDGYTPNQFDCDDRNPHIHPGAPEICNHIDDDCDGKTDETCDYDGDRYTPDQGDCDDREQLVNPGAYEVIGNDIDDNCNDLIDEPYEPCDAAHDRTPGTLAGAMELCDRWIIKSQVNGDGAPAARGVFTSFGASYKPKFGNNFTVLSTGIAGDENAPGFVEPQPGTAFESDHANPLPMNAANNVCGTSFPDEVTVHDYVELTYTLRVPTNAHSFSFQFNFLSSEYPEFVGREYNDKFLVLLQSKALNNGAVTNISFDENKNPITVNVGFFSVCVSGPICQGQKTNTCKTAVKDLNGTGYQIDDGTGIPQGGGTGWLTTTSPVAPGETATLRFVIFDESDHLLDSTVLIDNFQWQVTAAAAPMTIP